MNLIAIMTNQVKMRVPPLSEKQNNWETVEFDKVTASRMWLTMVVPGGHNPKNSTREKNQELFTGVYKICFLHEANPNPAGTGERASRSRQAGACTIIVADNSDNASLISTIGICAAKKSVVQIAIVDNMEQLSSSKGLAVEGLIKHYGIEDDCCFVNIQVDAYCETTRMGTGVPGKPFAMGGTIIGKSYDYVEQMALGAKRIKNLQKLLKTTLTKIIIPA